MLSRQLTTRGPLIGVFQKNAPPPAPAIETSFEVSQFMLAARTNSNYEQSLIDYGNDRHDCDDFDDGSNRAERCQPLLATVFNLSLSSR